MQFEMKTKDTTAYPTLSKVNNAGFLDQPETYMVSVLESWEQRSVCAIIPACKEPVVIFKYDTLTYR
jgi:hypothetical protein